MDDCVFRFIGGCRACWTEEAACRPWRMGCGQIVDALLGGLSTFADSFVGPNDAEYHAVQGSVVLYPFDPQQACQLVEWLGLTRWPSMPATPTRGTFVDDLGVFVAER